VAKQVIGGWITFYNAVKIHYTLKDRTPNGVDKHAPSADMTNTLDGLPRYLQAKQKQGLILSVLAA
jgi:hypothetical protein